MCREVTVRMRVLLFNIIYSCCSGQFAYCRASPAIRAGDMEVFSVTYVGGFITR
jgi:hypothetical protein